MATVTVHLRRLPPGAGFVVRSDAGGVAARGEVVGRGHDGVLVVVHEQGRARHTEWSGAVKVERVERARGG